MKKYWIIPILLMMLTGCGVQETFETISDDVAQTVNATPQQVLLELPEGVSSPTLETLESGKMYLCDGYTVTVQITDAGDLEQTLKNTTGFSRDELQILQTKQQEMKRYDWVWASVGESGDEMSRGCILDDGSHHYILTAMADANIFGQLQPVLQPLFRSFRVTQFEVNPNTGS